MAMVSFVTAFISPENDEYKKHARVLRACIEADIAELPKETANYFNSKYPETHLFEEKLEIKIPVHDYRDDMSEGFEIIISEIPKGVYKIRFTNSW